jgi:hypothetical protein
MKLALIRKIDFKFSSLAQSALLSISGTTDDMFIHMQLINSLLQKIFGVEHIRFSIKCGEINLEDVQHPVLYQIAQLVSSQIAEEFQKTASQALRAV